MVPLRFVSECFGANVEYVNATQPMTITLPSDALSKPVSYTHLMSVVWRTGGILIAAALLSLVFGVLAGGFAAKASAGFAQNLRKDMYDNVQTFSFANIDRFSTASLVTLSLIHI